MKRRSNKRERDQEVASWPPPTAETRHQMKGGSGFRHARAEARQIPNQTGLLRTTRLPISSQKRILPALPSPPNHCRAQGKRHGGQLQEVNKHGRRLVISHSRGATPCNVHAITGYWQERQNFPSLFFFFYVFSLIKMKSGFQRCMLSLSLSLKSSAALLPVDLPHIICLMAAHVTWQKSLVCEKRMTELSHSQRETVAFRGCLGLSLTPVRRMGIRFEVPCSVSFWCCFYTLRDRRDFYKEHLRDWQTDYR